MIKKWKLYLNFIIIWFKIFKSYFLYFNIEITKLLKILFLKIFQINDNKIINSNNNKANKIIQNMFKFKK